LEEREPAVAAVWDASRHGPDGPLLSMKLFFYLIEKKRNFILRSPA
jgi:hypothetical protein